MNKKITFAFALFGITASTFGVDILQAYTNLLVTSKIQARYTEAQFENWGVPREVETSQGYKAFITVLSNATVDAQYGYYQSLTNNASRIIFLSALTECGTNCYFNFVRQRVLSSRLSLSSALGDAQNDESLDECLSPSSTKLENYLMLNYSVPGISNLWVMSREIYSQGNQTNQVEWVDEVLSGKRKWEWENIDNPQEEVNE